MNKKIFSKQGFTIVELLLVMAVIAILAGTIMVSLSSQRERAMRSAMLSEMSGTIQPMLMCRTDNGTIRAPYNSGDICTLSHNYGSWPSTGPDTGFDTYSSGGLGTASWYIRVQGASGTICCNSGSNRCHELTTGACNANDP